MGTWVHFLLHSWLAPSPEARATVKIIFARGGKLILFRAKRLPVAGSK